MVVDWFLWLVALLCSPMRRPGPLRFGPIVSEHVAEGRLGARMRDAPEWLAAAAADPGAVVMPEAADRLESALATPRSIQAGSSSVVLGC